MTHAESIKAIESMCASLGLSDEERFIAGEVAITVIRAAAKGVRSAQAAGLLPETPGAHIERAAIAIALKALMDSKDIVAAGNQFRGI